MSNRSDGNKFEYELSLLLYAKRFWVHRMTQGPAGQPADIIAVKGGKAYLIDCKNCEGDTFVLSRVEDNQTSAMNLWSRCGNGSGWFAVRIHDHIYMVSHSALQFLICIDGKKSLTEEDLKAFGRSIADWISEVDGYES